MIDWTVPAPFDANIPQSWRCGGWDISVTDHRWERILTRSNEPYVCLLLRMKMRREGRDIDLEVPINSKVLKSQRYQAEYIMNECAPYIANKTEGLNMALDIPFVSEAYDRLREAQQTHGERVGIDPVDTADALRAARTELQMTQTALGERLGFGAPDMSKMESGAVPIQPRTDLAVRYLLWEARR